MQHAEDTLQVFKTSYTFENGLLPPGTEPGLGVEYDEALAAGFAYSTAYLPINRLQLDGTVHDW